MTYDDHSSPDCRVGKHGSCSRDAWCDRRDEPSDCYCECHAGQVTAS